MQSRDNVALRKPERQINNGQLYKNVDSLGNYRDGSSHYCSCSRKLENTCCVTRLFVAGLSVWG